MNKISKNEMVLSIVNRIMELNNKGCELIANVTVLGLSIHDQKKNCEDLLFSRGYIPSGLYFDEFWNDNFVETSEAIFKILKEYEEEL